MISSVNNAPSMDLDGLVEAMRGWNLELYPLGDALGPSGLAVLGAEGFLAMRAEIGAPTKQRGGSPQGLRTFGLPDVGTQGTRWCGHEVGPEALTVFEPDGGFDATARAGFGVLLCSLSEKRLTDACADLDVPEPDLLLGRAARVFEYADDTLVTLRARLHQLLTGTEASDPDLLDHAAHEIASLLVQAAAAGRERRPRIDPRRSQRALDDALAAIHEEPRAPHSVRALCERTGASERTLRYAFQQRFGVSPRTYLQALRLNGARHELRAAEPALETVTRVAQRWGFTNSGDFAAAYARIFGEWPSESLQRAARR